MQVDYKSFKERIAASKMDSDLVLKYFSSDKKFKFLRHASQFVDDDKSICFDKLDELDLDNDTTTFDVKEKMIKIEININNVATQYLQHVKKIIVTDDKQFLNIFASHFYVPVVNFNFKILNYIMPAIF
jgi:hypothetical protein